jgi:hypothetical protein
MEMPLFSLLILGALVLLIFIPKIQVGVLDDELLGYDQSEFDRQNEKLKLEDDTRKTLAQVLGGGFLLLGLIFTYSNFRLNQDAQIADRIGKAAILLKDDNIGVRLGGLNELGKIARDSPRDHWSIMVIISNYIKEQQEKITGDGVNSQKGQSNESIRSDIETALTIIVNRKIQNDPPGGEINLSRINFKGARLYSQFKNIVLTNADLREINSLTYDQIKGAIIDEETKLPSNLDSQKLELVNISKANKERNIEIQKRSPNEAVSANATFLKILLDEPMGQ